MTLQYPLQQTPRYRPVCWLFKWAALCLVLLATTAPARAADTWQALGGAAFSVGSAYESAMALDTAGRPYVAYSDTSNDSKATVMRLNAAGTGWETVGATGGVSASYAFYISLAFDSTGRPYISYMDWGNGSKATVMRLNDAGTDWEVVGTTGFSEPYPYYTSLAFDSTDRPYMAYQDWGNGSKATVMRLNDVGTDWEVVGTPGFSMGIVFDVSLAIGSGNRPYVTYADGGNNYKAMVMRLNDVGTDWEPVGGGESSADGAYYTSIRMDSTGRPYVAYASGAISQATVMRLNDASTGWDVVGSAEFSAMAVNYLSLALNSADRPYVAYMDESTSDKATVMRLNAAGTGWEVVGSAGFSADSATYTSLALNAQGRPFVAYVDAANNSKITVMQWLIAPSAPATPTVTVSNGEVTVGWQIPADDGGSALQSYTVTASPDSASCQATAPATSCTITGLTMGQTYTFTVTATNAQGTSLASAPSAAVTLSAPSSTAQAIPLLNTWGLAGLALVLAVLSALALRRRAS